MDNGYFVPYVSYTSDSEGTLTTGASKQVLSFHTGFDHVTPEQPQYQTIQAYYKPMQNVLPDGTPSYFQFKSRAGSFTVAGHVTSLSFSYDANTGVTTPAQGFSPGVSGLDIYFKVTPNDQRCSQALDFSDLGIAQRNQNVHYSMVYAGLSETVGSCMVVFQTCKPSQVRSPKDLL
ncbi:MAG: hypothetical protein R2877_05035 [Bdellovibrionota bacterium]